MIERYTLSKIGRIWSDQRKLEIMLNIEILACEAMAKLRAAEMPDPVGPRDA